MRDVALGLAEKGFAAACVGYRLAPLHSYPAAIEDCQEFVRYARTHSGELSVDPLRIASLGNSAGGYLAAMLGLADVSDSRVNAVVDICGISDLTKPREQHFPISWGFLEEFMGLPYEGNEWTYHEASPISRVTKDAPPFLLVHGESDDVVPVAQSHALAELLDDQQVRFELHTLPGEYHSFTFPAWQRIEQLYEEFLNSCFKHAYR